MEYLVVYKHIKIIELTKENFNFHLTHEKHDKEMSNITTFAAMIRKHTLEAQTISHTKDRGRDSLPVCLAVCMSVFLQFLGIQIIRYNSRDTICLSNDCHGTKLKGNSIIH